MSNTKEKIYVGQTALRFSFSTGADITGNTTTVILVRKPNSTTATWTATVDDASAGSIYYDVATATILASKGSYLLQPKITYNDDTISYGTTTKIQVFGLYD